MSPLFRIPFLAGFFSGAVGAGWLLLSAAFTPEGSGWQVASGPLSLLLMGGAIIFALFTLKRKKISGLLTFPVALRSALIVSLVTSIFLSAGAWYRWTHFKTDWQITEMISRSEREYRKAGRSESEIAENSRQLRESFTLGSEIKKTFAGVLIMGGLFALVFSLVFADRAGASGT